VSAHFGSDGLAAAMPHFPLDVCKCFCHQLETFHT